MDVWVTDNSSTKRRGQYIAFKKKWYAVADGPDGMEAHILDGTMRYFSTGRGIASSGTLSGAAASSQ